MALEAPAGAGERRSEPLAVVISYADVAFAVVCAVVVIALGGPVLGSVIGGGGWILQRLVAIADASWARRSRDPRRQLSISLFEQFGRIWLLAGAIVVSAVAGARADGLAAALIIFGAYTVAFVIKLFSGPPPPRESRR